MKKLVIVLLIILAALFGLIAIVGKDSSATLYDDAPHVNYSEIGTDVVGTNLFYFYQDSCAHCINIKPDVADFYYNKPEDVDFYLVDAAAAENSGVWASQEEEFVEPSGTFTDYTDIKIQGTPTLIEVKDGEITQFLVGENDIPAYLESL